MRPRLYVYRCTGRGARERGGLGPGADRAARRSALAALPPWVALIAGSLAVATCPALAFAQVDRGQAHPFPPTRISPQEPVTRLAVAWTDRTGSSRAVGLVDFGARVPFWIRRDPSGKWELAGSVAGGAFSRFDLERSDNELIDVHYRAAFRLRARIARTAMRLELFHASSHLGDEHLDRTGREPVSTSREGVELLGEVRPAAGLRLYGGPGLLLRSSRPLGRTSGRAGLEWEVPAAHGRVRAYAGVEVFAWEELEWEPQVSAEAGLGRGRFRLGVLLGAGPTRAEQLLPEEERLLGVVVSILH